MMMQNPQVTYHRIRPGGLSYIILMDYSLNPKYFTALL